MERLKIKKIDISRNKNLIICFVVFVILLVFLTYIDVYNTYSNKTYQILFSVAKTIVFIICGCITHKFFWNTVLIADSDGICFPMWKDIIFEWNDIEGFTLYTVGNREMIRLDLKKEEKYFGFFLRQKRLRERKKKGYPLISIPVDITGYSGEQLVEELNHYVRYYAKG